VKTELKNRENSEKTVVEIAFAADFKSKSTFNDVFKSSTGLTPSEFRDKNLNNSSSK